MIVENKEFTLGLAHEMANEFLVAFGKESQKLIGKDDPAEHIYLLIHTVGYITRRSLDLVENYAKIYGIEKLDKKITAEWLAEIVKD